MKAHPLLSRGSVLSERVAERTVKLAAFLVVGFLVLIFVFIGKEALPIFYSSEVHQEVDVVRLFLPQPQREDGHLAFAWKPVSERPVFSLLPLLVGTLKVTLVAIFLAVPVSLAAAIFTAEFAPFYLKEVMKPIVELLAGVPSVVVGFFTLMVIATYLQNAFGWTLRLNAISAGVGLSLAVIPIVFSIAEDALTAVPESYREGSYALGANRWQTAWRVVFPAALPGVFAACVLGFGRAIGETMIVLMSSGNAASMSISPTESFRSFSATIAAELAEVVVGSAHYHVLFFIGSFLFIITFATNFLGNWYVRRLQARLQGKGK